MPKKKTGSKAGTAAQAVREPRDKPGSGRVKVGTVSKPWGHETIWALTDRYVGKILHINAGHELSVQYHNVKDETVYLLSGQIVYRVKGNAGLLEDSNLRLGEAFRITPGTIHQRIALTDCDVLEVSTV